MNLFILTLRLIIIIWLPVNCCTDFCKCSVVKSRALEHIEIGQKAICSAGIGLADVNELQLNLLPNNTIHLIIHEAFLPRIKSQSFVDLPELIKLDLSKNNISEIQGDAFAGLSLLEKLDLSQNKIANLLPEIFKPLASLQRLILEGNFISRLPDELFEHQSALKTLDLANNPLICDCQLRWLVEWSRINRARIPPSTNCQFPSKLRGTSLSRLTKKDLHCKWPVQLPLFELIPPTNQLVFKGDSLVLICRVSIVEPGTHIIWMLNDENVSVSVPNDIDIFAQPSSDGSTLVSSLSIKRLETNHSGVWMCQATTSRGNESKEIQVVVVSARSKICPRTISLNNKGQYVWAETLAGITVEADCVGTPSANLDRQEGHAYHTCTTSGVWDNLDTSKCPYVSEVTKVLEQFAKTNFTLSKTNILDSARGLRNYTSDSSLLQDKMDIIYISHTLANYIHYVPHQREMAEIIVDIVNTVMSVDRNLLTAAQSDDQACSRFLKILEQLPDLMTSSTLNHFRDNIAVEEFFVKSENFPGMTCNSYVKSNFKQKVLKTWSGGRSFQGDKVLHCNMANNTVISDDLADTVEASLQLPSTIFVQNGLTSPSHVHNHKLQFIIYRDSIFFPSSDTDNPAFDITSSVISGKIAHVTSYNLTEPVVVALRTAAYTTDVRPVWWDSQALGGRGKWSTEGCSVLKVHKNVVTFSCSHLGSFGLLQDVEALIVKYGLQMAQFRPCHPAIYVGTVLCVVPLCVSIVVYCYGFKKLQMPKKTRHSLINTWLSLTLLCLVFSFGIYQTDIAPICQGVGLTLHYLTLCTLLWMLITANNLYKKLTRSETAEHPPDEPLPDHPLPPKPMLRFYLVGWGIASIVCGISAAVHVENYGGSNFCFLSFSPSLGALYGPAGILLALIAFFYLLIQCTLASGKTLSHNVLPEENVVLELTQINLSSSRDTQSESGNSDSEEDTEHSSQTQLRSQAILLLLFVLSWLTASASIGRPLSNYLPEDELIFALLFCIFSFILGVFVFVLFCYKRADVRNCLLSLCACPKFVVKIEESSGDNPIVVRLDATVPSALSHETQSLGNKSATLVNIGAANPLSTTDPNLLHSCSSDYSATGAEMFYDPRQSVVARRFFEKNRRQQHLQQLQKNNLEKAANQDQTKEASVKSQGSNSSQPAVDHRTSKIGDECLNDIALKRQKNSSSSGNVKVSVNLGERNWPLEVDSRKLPSLSRKENSCGKDLCGVLSDNNVLPTSRVLHSCCSDVNVNAFSKPKKPRNRLKKRQHSWDSRHRASARSRSSVHHEPKITIDKKCSCCFSRSHSTYEQLAKKVLEGMVSSPSDLSSESSKCLHREIC